MYSPISQSIFPNFFSFSPLTITNIYNKTNRCFLNDKHVQNYRLRPWKAITCRTNLAHTVCFYKQSFMRKQVRSQLICQHVTEAASICISYRMAHIAKLFTSRLKNIWERRHKHVYVTSQFLSTSVFQHTVHWLFPPHYSVEEASPLRNGICSLKANQVTPFCRNGVLPMAGLLPYLCEYTYYSSQR